MNALGAYPAKSLSLNQAINFHIVELILFLRDMAPVPLPSLVLRTPLRAALPEDLRRKVLVDKCPLLGQPSLPDVPAGIAKQEGVLSKSIDAILTAIYGISHLNAPTKVI